MAYSKAQGKATMKYRASHKEQLNIDINKGMKDIYKAQAAKRGKSLQAYIISLIEKDMENNE